jgi:hypothetical protein
MLLIHFAPSSGVPWEVGGPGRDAKGAAIVMWLDIPEHLWRIDQVYPGKKKYSLHR